MPTRVVFARALSSHVLPVGQANSIEGCKLSEVPVVSARPLLGPFDAAQHVTTAPHFRLLSPPDLTSIMCDVHLAGRLELAHEMV